MALISFTANHQDLSTYRGYQFKFFCDRCGNGYVSAHETSLTGLAGLLLGAFSYLGLGGWFHGWWLAGELKDYGLKGKPHDDAFARAVRECQGHFHQCKRCGHWVCPEVCWNGAAGLCAGCAPEFQPELTAQKAQAGNAAMSEQIRAQARQIDYTAGTALQAPPATPAAVNFCPACGAKAAGGRFCAGCGQALTV